MITEGIGRPMTRVSDFGLLTLLGVDGVSIFRSHILTPVIDLPKGTLTPPPNRACYFHSTRLSTSLKRS